MEILKKARKQKGLTIRELARMTRIPASQICEIEHGKRNLPKDEEKLSDLYFILGIEPSDLGLNQALNTATRRLEALKKQVGIDVLLKAMNIVTGT